MRIVVSPRAEKELRRISKVDQIAVVKKIRSLSGTQSQQKAEVLKGYKNIIRIRIGDYRIVYRKRGSDIYIVLIGHRKHVYQLLKQLFK